MVNWNKILESNHSKKVIRSFATSGICARAASTQLQDPEAKREFNLAVREHQTPYTRRLARKALRRRGALA